MESSPLAVLLPILLASLVVLAGIGTYLRKEWDRWYTQWKLVQVQRANVQANEVQIRRMWMEARLARPDFHLDGVAEAERLQRWIDQEQPLLRPKEIGRILPIQEELLGFLIETLERQCDG